MFALYALIVCVGFAFLDLLFFKTYQLENYKLKNYIKRVLKFQFAWGSKTPLVYTNRIKRLFFCDFFLKFATFLLIFAFLHKFWLYFLISLLFVACAHFYVILSFLIALPIEKVIKQRFILRAKKKLKNCACKTIAITGSFGKTSTKNILYQILKEEFDVCATPKSFNTPMGICKTILEDLKETDDFLIVEFGARQEGDIEELAKMVGVDFGIITPIGGCHLETFGSLEAIENTKYELCDNTKNWMVFNGKSKSTKNLFDRFDRKKYLVATEGSFAYAKDIKTTPNGSEFVLCLDGNKFACTCPLLTNLDNVVVAASMAYLLGESMVAIHRGISSLKQVPHRMELIRGYVTVIDDSYNSNLEGFKSALQVLSSFDGRKIVVSPGIVELGSSQFEVNFQAGMEVAKVADEFIIMNKTNKDALSKGASTMNNIHYANTRQKQAEILKQIIKAGDVVLFENDFPDNIK